MDIRDYKENDEEHIFKLFTLAFGRPMNREMWFWRFQNNPAGKHFIKLMWEDDLLIGHYAVSPMFMSVGDKKMLGALSMTTMTHPEFGRRGIFGKLANALNEDLEKIENFAGVWGFPNSNSHYGFIKNLGWKDLGVLNHLIKDASDVTLELSDNIKIDNSFNGDHCKILEEITKSSKVAVLRDEVYLSWRYTNHPKIEYHTFSYTISNDLKAFLVVKTYPSDIEGIDNIFIAEYGIPFEELALLPIFMSHIKAYFKNINNFNLWLPLSNKNHIYLEKAGFKLGGVPTFLGIRSHKEEINLINNLDHWHYSYGDSDVY